MSAGLIDLMKRRRRRGLRYITVRAKADDELLEQNRFQCYNRSQIEATANPVMLYYLVVTFTASHPALNHAL